MQIHQTETSLVNRKYEHNINLKCFHIWKNCDFQHNFAKLFPEKPRSLHVATALIKSGLIRRRPIWKVEIKPYHISFDGA